MKEPELHGRIVAVLLLAGCLRTLALRFAPAPAELMDPASGPPTALPELAGADWVRLTWLPGIGEARGRRIVELRPFLGQPLTPERLHLLPGCGETLEQQVRAWYRSEGWTGVAPPPPPPPVRPPSGSP
ncbi:MAG: hypothetical protein EYC70_16575 [Planctomycetota bacterium]|nr:MAG: hypothetical protein EYC70_16575 [Planctomycetota bacterium]